MGVQWAALSPSESTMHCACGHSEAAHARTAGAGCAFCNCRAFHVPEDSKSPPHADPDKPDELTGALAILAQNPAFSNLAPGELDALAQRGQKRIILKDAIVMDKGQVSDRLYLVLQGRISVNRPAAGAVAELRATLGPGDIVGEVGLLHGALHTATVTALDDLHVLEFMKDDLRAVFQEHHGLQLAFLRMMHHRLQMKPQGSGVQTEELQR